MEATIRGILQSYIEKIKLDTINNMASHQRNVTGKSVRSLTTQVIGNGEAIMYGSSSFLAMERGRAGGRVPRDFFSIIKQWVVDRGISVTPIKPKPTKNGNVRRNVKLTPYERGLNHLSGAIAYRIIKDGTRLHRRNQFDDIFSTSVEENTKEMFDKVSFYISEIVTEKLVK